MKNYVVYESNYGDLIIEGCSATNIIGVFTSYEKALKCFNNQINKGIEDGFVKDGEYTESKISVPYKHITMFSGYQENWNRYYEIEIKDIVVDYMTEE